MLKFFTNRQLADTFGINLAKWKRWSREFLPPDPLGGMQSGYARQYHPDQAFTVRLGGHLVADLRFTIPEARQILRDLRDWLKENGFYFDARGNARPKSGIDAEVENYMIFIEPVENRGFHYVIRGMISKTPVFFKGHPIMEERYTETVIGPAGEASDVEPTGMTKLLHLTDLLVDFARRLNLETNHYRAL